MNLGIHMGLTGSGVAVLSGVAQVLVEWTDSSSDETGFRIEWSLASNYSPLVSSATVAAGVEEYTIAGLTYDTLYYVRVYAYNGEGYSAVYNGSVTPTTT